jgi:serine/threonine protein kinase/Tol biopolymer transport system component
MSMIGKTLGTFTLEAQIGKGGMGEVYRAKDQKLGRDVAIKVLPEAFAKDADRVARFQREAKLLASLNHPNIAAIYGLEESDGTHFLVLELIEGDTLADRLKRGPVPVEESLKLALQIAEALEAAHEKGVIHRDLKPANIKVTPDGKVKVLDFGLAKAFAGDSEDMNLSNSPTLSVAATQQGIILGTAAYMSPEQASGETTDKRTDIWAFGVVLFEMLTGGSLFEGNNVSQTLASVIKSEPEWQTLPPNLHPRIRLLLERCLEKESKNRYHDIADARVDIQKVLSDPSGVFAQTITTVKPRKKLRLGLPWVAAALVLGAIIAGMAVWMLRPTDPRQVMRFYHELPEGQMFTNLAASLVDFSADGKKIVYVANEQLYIRNLSEPTAKPIKGADGDPFAPVFSPDGQWVSYFSGADSQIKKIAIGGAAPVTLCDADMPLGAVWDSNDTILFGQSTGIMRFSEHEGTAELLVKAKEGERISVSQVLPGGEWVLCTLKSIHSGVWDEAQVAAQSLRSGERRLLVPGGRDARYVPTGHLVYALGDVLYARPFDVDRLKFTGGAVSVVEGVRMAGVTGSASYVFSNTGMLAYVAGGNIEAAERSLVWVDRSGREEALAAEPKVYLDPRISPDGKKVALGIWDSAEDNEDIYIWDLAGETLDRLTFDGASDRYPVWSPNGKRIFFSSDHGAEPAGIYWKAADGTGEREHVASIQDRDLLPFSWSVNGDTLLLQEYVGNPFGLDIGALLMEGDHARTPILQEEYWEHNPQISPNGRWMAYVSNESGDPEVCVSPFPEIKGKRQVSTNGGNEPIWSPDGKELFYRNGDSVMAVEVQTEPSFKRGNPVLLFRGRYIATGVVNIRTWDIHPDTGKFLMLKEFTDDSDTEGIPRAKINIIANWFEELQDRVPVD